MNQNHQSVQIKDDPVLKKTKSGEIRSVDLEDQISEANVPSDSDFYLQ